MAELPHHSGVRSAEVADLEVADVRMSARKGRLIIRGKGDKRREVPINAALRERLQAWLDVRPQWPGAEFPSLLLAERGHGLTSRTVYDAPAWAAPHPDAGPMVMS